MKLFSEGLTGKLFRFLEPVLARIFYQYPRDIYL